MILLNSKQIVTATAVNGPIMLTGGLISHMVARYKSQNLFRYVAIFKAKNDAETTLSGQHYTYVPREHVANAAL